MLRIPGEGFVIGISSCDYAAWFGDAAHLFQHVDGIADVLQCLMAEDDIERTVLEWELVAIQLLERDILHLSLFC